MKNFKMNREEFEEGLDMKTIQMSGVLISIFAGILCLINFSTGNLGIAPIYAECIT